MRPFQVDTLTTTKKLTREEIDVIEQLAFQIFDEAYQGQYRRIKNAIKRAKPSTLQKFLTNPQWELEPDLVDRAVRKWYDDTVGDVGLDTIRTYGMDVQWKDVNEGLLKVSAKRAGWFAKAMTETSMEQTQEVIGKWLKEEGETIADLTDMLSTVWTGPRPRAAAVTETTNIVTESEIAIGIAEGYWGYDVHTSNDNRVRPSHTETAKNGPYPMKDTEHRPPINGDIVCRCIITLVMEAPKVKK